MSRLTMAKETKKQGAEKPKPEFSTFRVYLEAGQDMSDLSGLEGRSAADVYEEYCAPLVREILKKKMQERLKKLNG